jgi:hypothetical protein
MLMASDISRSQFGIWSNHFFNYLCTEKKSSSPGLLQLIYCLGQDGQVEMACSVFNFLRMENWKSFCKCQYERKLLLKKTLSASAKNLKKARQGYSKLLVLAPEIWIERPLAGGERLPLSDVLEREAYFLAAQARMERLSAELVFTQGQKPSHSKARRARVARALTETSTALKLAASSYRTLRDLDSYVPFDYPVEALTAAQLVAVLQAEQAKLTGVLARVDMAFNTKRFGIAACTAILVRLQDFVEEFQFRSQSYMPETAAKRLGEIDLADLLEAGKAALGLTGDSTITNPSSIGRAIERFRDRKSNEQTLSLWQRSAAEACGRLPNIPPPFVATTLDAIF